MVPGKLFSRKPAVALQASAFALRAMADQMAGQEMRPSTLLRIFDKIARRAKEEGTIVNSPKRKPQIKKITFILQIPPPSPNGTAECLGFLSVALSGLIFIDAGECHLF